MTPLSFARRIVGAASRLVPKWRRAEWQREWDAELVEESRGRRRQGIGVVSRSAGSVADAAFLRGQALYLDLWLGDLRFAWRGVARRPGFTLLVVATLALAIGVNSAVFAIVNAVLLRPLPYRDPSRVVFVWQTLPEHGIFEGEPTAFDYDAWHAVRSFSEIALVANGAFTLTGDDAEPERLRGAGVTASLMPLLGLQPQLGRAFTPQEDVDGTPASAILSERLWRRRFGADPRILGRMIQVNGAPRIVVGVMPRSAALPGPLAGDDDIWLSASMSAADRTNAHSHNYEVLARLADGVALPQASAEITAFSARTAAEQATTHRGIGARLVPLPEQATRQIKPTLAVLAAGVAFLLVVAAANASTLLLARAASRRQELAVREALGATKLRLLSLATAESLVLTVMGGLAGLAIGGWTLHLLLPLFASALPPGTPIDVDAPVALFAAGVSVAIGLMLGAALAADRSGEGLAAGLRTSSRSTASFSAARTRAALVVAQVALAVVLLSAAGLMLASVVRLSRVSPGFQQDHLLTFRLALSGSTYTSPAARVAFTTDLLQRLRAVPTVTGTDLVSMIPFGGGRGANAVEIEGQPRAPGEIQMIIDQRYISGRYLQTMGIPLLVGRPFAASDDNRAERVTLVNRTMADRYWPGRSPIDHRVRMAAGFDSGIWFRIVGVVDDVRHIGLSHEPVPEMYHPYEQAPVAAFAVVVRTSGDPAAAAPAARAAVQRTDPNLPVYDMRTMDERIAASFAQTRGTMILLLVTAVLAATLAAIAIYGSIWYAVSQQIPEIGIRLALGATRLSVCGAVVARAAALSAIGTALGTVAALAVTRGLQTLLFATQATDPRIYAAVVGALLVLTIAASIGPARRAMRVDPLTALRAD